MGSRSHRPPECISRLLSDRGMSDSTVCGSTIARSAAGVGLSGRFLWHGNLLWLRDHGERDIPYRRARPGAGLHLQRRAYHEFDGSASDWARWTGERIELGFLYMCGRISTRGADDDAVAGDSGEEPRVAGNVE